MIATTLTREDELRTLAALDIDSLLTHGHKGHIRHLDVAIPDLPGAFTGEADADDVAIVERIVGRPVTTRHGRWPYNATLRARLRRWALVNARRAALG